MKVDLAFKREVLDLMVGGHDISYCQQCGYCNMRCPINQRVGSRYNPRDLVLLSLMGYKEAILKREPFYIWGCTGCETCDEVCPQEIPITEIISILKNYSTQEGKAPKYYPTLTQSIIDCGKAIPSQTAIEKRREKMALPVSTSVPVEEIKTIMEATGTPGWLAKYKGGSQ
jgi:heterodisulfide reductase subunit C